MKTLRITTHGKESVLDLTDLAQTMLTEEGYTEGVCIVFAAHTTCAITTADLDPGTDRDLLQALRSLLPAQRYQHPHDPDHAPDHILSSLIGPSVSVPFYNGRLALGVWQRIVLVELDGPRERAIHLSVIS